METFSRSKRGKRRRSSCEIGKRTRRDGAWLGESLDCRTLRLFVMQIKLLPFNQIQTLNPENLLEYANSSPSSLTFHFQARCNREKPPCKYYHPPQHLKDQLLINGRNHLALKNALMQQMGMPPNGQQIITNQMQPMVSGRECKSTRLCL